MNYPTLLPVPKQWLTFGVILASATFSQALTILSDPVITLATNAPLAGFLELATDDYSRVSFSVSDGTNSWERSFYDYRKKHSLPLMGFKANRNYEVEITVRDKFGNEVTHPEPILLATAPLPASFPTIVVVKSEPERMEPGYTEFKATRGGTTNAYVIIVDQAGEVVWFYAIPSNVWGERRLEDGDFLIPYPRYFDKINMLGQTVRRWELPDGRTYHHEAFPTDHGTILFLSNASLMVTNYPSSATIPDAPKKTTKVWHNPIVEMSTETGAILNTWSDIDMLDPTRIGYLSLLPNGLWGADWTHSNAVIEDQRDDSIIVSSRHQNAVFKFSRATGQLKWILGPHENWGPQWQPYLLTPVGTPFEWQYAQHAPMLTPQGTLLLFDNGNDRASPFDSRMAQTNSYSRAVEYDINEETMEVSQVWEYGKNATPRFFADRVGDANWLPETGNVLVTFGYAVFVDGVRPSPYSTGAAMIRIQEVTHDQTPEVVFDLALWDFDNTRSSYRGYTGYRGDRIADLYPVITPTEALERLLQSVLDADLRRGWSLVATLRNAIAFRPRAPKLSVILLKVFQHKVRAQVARLEPELATQFTMQAQGIIDAINEGKLSWPGSLQSNRFPLKAELKQGRPILAFSGDEARVYLIETSSDLMHWEKCGVAKHRGGGNFDFEDACPQDSLIRYYRVVSP
jgi:arylsulfate sulfotransferase